MKILTGPFSQELLDGKLDAAEGAVAEFEVPADADKFHILDSVQCSYGGAGDVTGTLEVYFGGLLRWTILLYEENDFTFTWPRGLYMGTLNQALKVTLTSVANYTGKVSANYRSVRNLPQERQLSTYAIGVADSPAQNAVAANANHAYCIDAIHCAYGDTPAAGTLTIAFGGVTKWKVDILDDSPYEFIFPRGLYTGTKNEAILVTMASDVAVKHLNTSYR